MTGMRNERHDGSRGGRDGGPRQPSFWRAGPVRGQVRLVRREGQVGGDVLSGPGADGQYLHKVQRPSQMQMDHGEDAQEGERDAGASCMKDLWTRQCGDMTCALESLKKPMKGRPQAD